ncbi:J domain-containing protein [Burkholderia sp. SRS-W-2-2016]|uniref:J domain-containing protein n=1 Tax=Burkholderia sp. SRS-W-2-2016 TaxID=1926878 RepID=UPI0015B93594|nr:J domain-containing protein [Burkholderia sp. SRS-W-2-2016]
MATLYDTLGVPAHATDEEIKRAYRKAAMKWHPDRNHGAEDTARAAFQEIKDAYAILSDAEQRKVYDTVYAEQMSAFEAELSGRRREQAERDAAARAADEAAYAEMVSIAIRFADEGHNRDVLFGVLLGRQCEPQRAAQIADSVAALQAARREEAELAQQKRHARKAARNAKAQHGAAQQPESEPAEAAEAGATSADTATDTAQTAARHGHHDAPHAGRAQQPKRDEAATDMHPASALSNLWLQFLNGLKF